MESTTKTKKEKSTIDTNEYAQKNCWQIKYKLIYESNEETRNGEIHMGMVWSISWSVPPEKAPQDLVSSLECTVGLCL